MANNHGETSPSRVPPPDNSSASAATSSGHTGPGHPNQQSGERSPPQSGRNNQNGNNATTNEYNHANTNTMRQERTASINNNEGRNVINRDEGNGVIRIWQENINGRQALRQGHRSAVDVQVIRGIRTDGPAGSWSQHL